MGILLLIEVLSNLLDGFLYQGAPINLIASGGLIVFEFVLLYYSLTRTV